ncbi:hypothetical protein [Nocardia asteroides]
MVVADERLRPGRRSVVGPSGVLGALVAVVLLNAQRGLLGQRLRP